MWHNHLRSIEFHFAGLLLVVCLGASACGEGVLRPGFSDGDSGPRSGSDSAVYPDAGRIVSQDTGRSADADGAEAGTDDAAVDSLGADGSGPDSSAQDAAPTPDQGPSSDAAPMPLAYDVVVVGAGTGGVAAAIQAARMGMRVALIEETDWVGGQATAGGVSTMDANRQARQWESGIYAEFITRAVAHYAKMGKSVGTCYFSADDVTGKFDHAPQGDCGSP